MTSPLEMFFLLPTSPLPTDAPRHWANGHCLTIPGSIIDHRPGIGLGCNTRGFHPLSVAVARDTPLHMCGCVCVYVLHIVNMNTSSRFLSLCPPFYFSFALINQLLNLRMRILLPVSNSPSCSTSSVPISGSATPIHLPPPKH